MFSRILDHLRTVAEHGQPGRGEEVLVSRRHLSELIVQFDRLDAEAQRQHRKDHPAQYG